MKELLAPWKFIPRRAVAVLYDSTAMDCSSVGWTKEGDIICDGDHLDVRTSSQFGGVDCWLESKAEEKAGEGLSLQAARLRGECANEKTCVVEE